ncbi:PT domain-containing protein [Proteinivorax hydrogeniformans]
MFGSRHCSPTAIWVSFGSSLGLGLMFSYPTIQPSNHPTIQPSNHPTIQPSNHPTIQPSNWF